MVWEYVNPVVDSGPLTQGDSIALDHRGHQLNAVFKIQRYTPEYAGQAGQDLTPGAPIELYPSVGDWIEIYNAGSQAVDLGGQYLTDDLGQPTRWQIPAGVSVEAGGYLLFWADDGAEPGDTHTNFELDAGGEANGLFDADGTTLTDAYTFGPQTTDVSEGRCPDGGSTWHFCTTATPGAPNGPCSTAVVYLPLILKER